MVPIWARTWLVSDRQLDAALVPNVRCSSRTPLRGTITCWFVLALVLQGHFAQRQTMSVRRNCTQGRNPRFEKQTVQVVPDVCWAIEKCVLSIQASEFALGHRQSLLRVDLLDQRKLRSRECRQRETALARP